MSNLKSVILQSQKAFKTVFSLNQKLAFQQIHPNDTQKLNPLGFNWPFFHTFDFTLYISHFKTVYLASFKIILVSTPCLIWDFFIFYFLTAKTTNMFNNHFHNLKCKINCKLKKSYAQVLQIKLFGTTFLKM